MATFFAKKLRREQLTKSNFILLTKKSLEIVKNKNNGDRKL